MKRTLRSIFLSILTVVLVACSDGPVNNDPDVGVFEYEDRTYITRNQFVADLEAGQDMFLLDIRPEERYNEIRLINSVSTFAMSLDEAGAREAIYAAIANVNGRSIIILCNSGGGGASDAWDHLIFLGYDMDTVFILEEGVNSWPTGSPYDAFVERG